MTLKWIKRLYIERPNYQPIRKTRAHLLTQIPCQMGFSPNGLGPKCQVPLISNLHYKSLKEKSNHGWNE
jgi:hypothetical protein